MPTPVIIIHGGAIERVRHEAAWRDFMARIVKSGMETLKSGASALEAVTHAVTLLEDSGHFNAGRGAVRNAKGAVELDAAVMEGHTGRAGSAALLQRTKNPILAARLVMERTPHIMLAGPDAEAELHQIGAETVEATRYFKNSEKAAAPNSDTVGAVALDAQGNLAAATSTGGISHKMAGRIGDSPILGAGCFATRHAAISCTGAGEYFIRASAASRLAFAMEYGGLTLADAAREALQAVGRLGGIGGLIALDCHGNLALPFNGFGMIRGWMRGRDSAPHIRLTDV